MFSGGSFIFRGWGELKITGRDRADMSVICDCECQLEGASSSSSYMIKSLRKTLSKSLCVIDPRNKQFVQTWAEYIQTTRAKVQTATTEKTRTEVPSDVSRNGFSEVVGPSQETAECSTSMSE